MLFHGYLHEGKLLYIQSCKVSNSFEIQLPKTDHARVIFQEKNTLCHLRVAIIASHIKSPGKIDTEFVFISFCYNANLHMLNGNDTSMQTSHFSSSSSVLLKGTSVSARKVPLGVE